ncbi:T-cell differentiation antigen CD6-like isoform X9 [Xiphophorus hellerii]|uniref:T-cell differentiation antigen CD6-like isoform X9 n=1 Tax=Xiphophorus hellerii TaxID=8084 RepID=UPI0013B401A9|nr:T-cell differentiation antigen CD6-like isoform X9 [Xiphophorus hellerii]
MKLLQFLWILQLSSLSPVLLDVFTPDPLTTETPEEFDYDPYVHHLGSTCRWTLRMPGDRSGEAVPLPPDFLDTLAEWICQDLKCGRVHIMKEIVAPQDSKCFQDCRYQDRHLRSCLETFTAGCNVTTEVVCGHQSVRLKGAKDQCAGRVEVWKDRMWGTVCDDRFDLREANVVCAQLGCGTALKVTGQNGLFPPGSGPIHLDELNCTGNEQNLWFCPGVQENSDCGHKEDAGVVCSGHQSVRLKGAKDQCAGRVEVWKDRMWGTVCDDRFDLREANVVCAQLGCGTALKVTGQNGLFPPGSGPIHLDELNCTGNEQNLWFCPGVQENSDCGHKEDAGVVCSDSKAFFGVTTEVAPDAPQTELMTTARLVGVPSPERLSIVVLALGLLVFAILNLVLCCLYRRRHVLLLQQTRSKQAAPSDPPQNLYKANQNLVRAGPVPLQAAVPSESRTAWSRTRRADSESGDPDCEPSARMSTFYNSQRYRTDLKPSALSSLCEEGSGAAADAQFGRASRISEDSFDSSSTSSGECYENVIPSQNPTRSGRSRSQQNLTSESGQNRAGSPPPYTNTGFQFALGGKGAEPSSGKGQRETTSHVHRHDADAPLSLGDDEDEDDYCPVSPD